MSNMYDEDIKVSAKTLITLYMAIGESINRINKLQKKILQKNIDNKKNMGQLIIEVKYNNVGLSAQEVVDQLTETLQEQSGATTGDLVFQGTPVYFNITDTVVQLLFKQHLPLRDYIG